MKKTLNHTDMQSLELAELESVSGGFGPRGGSSTLGGRGFTQGIPFPEGPEGIIGGGGGLLGGGGGGFPLGTPTQDFDLQAEVAGDLIGG